VGRLACGPLALARHFAARSGALGRGQHPCRHTSFPRASTAALVNLAASIAGACLGEPQLHGRSGGDGVGGNGRRSCATVVDPAGPSWRRRSWSCRRAVEPIWLVGRRRRDHRRKRDWPRSRWCVLAPIRRARAGCGGDPQARPSTTRPPSSSAVGSTGEAEGGRALSLQHRLQRRGDHPGLSRPARPDRFRGIRPYFHSFGYTSFWLAANYGMGTVLHANPLDAGTVGTLAWAIPGDQSAGDRRRLLTASINGAAPPAQFGSLRFGDSPAAREAAGGAGRVVRGTISASGPLEGYGMTECSPGRRRQHARLPRPPASSSPARAAATWEHPLPGRGPVRVVDPETGEPARDEPGRRHGAGQGGPTYDESATSGVRRPDGGASLRDGWYVTGDIGAHGRGWIPEDHRAALAVLEDRRRDGPAWPPSRRPCTGPSRPTARFFAVTRGGRRAPRESDSPSVHTPRRRGDRRGAREARQRRFAEPFHPRARIILQGSTRSRSLGNGKLSTLRSDQGG